MPRSPLEARAFPFAFLENRRERSGVHFGSSKVDDHELVSLGCFAQHKVVDFDVVEDDRVRVKELENSHRRSRNDIAHVFGKAASARFHICRQTHGEEFHGEVGHFSVLRGSRDEVFHSLRVPREMGDFCL